MKTTIPLILAVVMVWSTPGKAFEAHDDGNDAAYIPEETWLGINGGSGFSAWERIGGDATSVEADFRDSEPGGEDNWGDFTLKTRGDEAVVGRNFVDANGTVVLGTGTLTVRGWLHPEAEDEFLGFAVFDASRSELLRWGIGTGENDAGELREGFVYRTGSGHYHLLEPDGPDGFFDFKLTWGSVDGGLSFALSGADSGGTPYAWNDFMPISVNRVVGVGGLGVIASNVNGENLAKMSFDQVSVKGVIVPEPGTLSLLSAGMAVLSSLLYRRNRR